MIVFPHPSPETGHESLVVNWNNWNVSSFRIAEVDTTTVSFFCPDSFEENVSFTSCPQNRD